jgi:hypothetical protein
MNCRVIYPVFFNFGVCVRYLAGVHFVVPISVVARLKAWVSAARLLGLWVPIAPGTRMCVACDCCVLSGRGLWDGSITHHEKYYRVCDVSHSLTSKFQR